MKFAVIAWCGAITWLGLVQSASAEGFAGRVAIEWGIDGADRVTVAMDGGIDTTDQNENGSTIHPDAFDVEDVDPGGERYTRFLVVDTSNDNIVMPVHQTGMHFSSPDAFYEWAESQLHAELIRDAKTEEVIGVQWIVYQVGTPMYATSDGQLHAVDDFLATLVGGLEKKVYIGEQVYDLSPSEGAAPMASTAASTASAFPSDITACNDPLRPTDCIEGESFNTHTPIIHIYDHVGSETNQKLGGFQENSKFCWLDGFFPWICTTHSGANRLTVHNVFFKHPDGASAIPWLTGTVTQLNVTGVESDILSWGFGFSSGSIPVSQPPTTSVSATTGVCAVHSNNSSITVRTGDGDFNFHSCP